MPNVGFMTGDFSINYDPPEPNGCAYYRMVLPGVQLTRMGWEVKVGMPRSHPEMGIGVSYNDGAFFGWDISVFKLLMHESVPTLFKVMQDAGSRVVVDIDDFHFALHPENIASHVTDPNRNPENNRMWYEMGIRVADTITVSTAFLADFYQRRCRDVRLVRNALDTERYSPVEQGESPVIGWVGGTPWRSGDIEMLKDWLPGFVNDHGLRVQHSGHIPGDPKHFAARAGLRRVQTLPMTPVSRYPTLLAGIHIGLVPLRLSPFNEAKSYLKGLEYAAAGIPFIASPSEEYRVLHEAGVGRLAGTPDEWRDHATELLDPDVRSAEAERQREIVCREFDISTKGEQWATALAG